jgi:hypothetical protein
MAGSDQPGGTMREVMDRGCFSMVRPVNTQYPEGRP